MDISFSGTDTILQSVKSRTSRPREGFFTILTVLHADGTSQTVVAEDDVLRTVRSGDLLYTIETGLTTSKPVSVSYRVREYDLRSGKGRTLIGPQQRNVLGIDLYNDRLYVLRRLDTPGRVLLSMGTIPVGRGDLESSHTLSMSDVLPPEVVSMGTFWVFRGLAYCPVQFIKQTPQYGVCRVDFASKTVEKLLEAPRYLDFCIVPDGPHLAYLSPDSPATGTRHAYTLTFLPLGETTERPVAAKLNAGEIRFYGGLQYDAKGRSFVIRGNTPPYSPPNQYFYRIRVNNVSN